MNRIDFEIQTYQYVKQYMISALELLSNNKIRCTCEFEDLGKSSEIRINFFKGNEYLDTCEFFVYYNNKPNVTMEEIALYIQEVIKEVVE